MHLEFFVLINLFNFKSQHEHVFGRITKNVNFFLLLPKHIFEI